MKKYLPFIALFLAIVFYVLYRRENVRNETNEKSIKNIDALHYVAGNIVLEKDKRIATDSFDWLGDQCACQVSGSDAMVIMSLRPIPYTYETIAFPVPELVLPPYIKGAFDITRDERRNAMSVYTPPVKTFVWGWDGLRRVIRTSDGDVLATGLGNRQFDRADGGNLIDPITAISYNGFVYRLGG